MKLGRIRKLPATAKAYVWSQWFWIRWELGRQQPYFTRYYGYNLIYGAGDSLVSRLAKGAGYEPEIIRLAQTMVDADSVIIDVGSNIGMFSLPLASFADQATIHCFEPSPHPGELFALTLSRNKLESRIKLNRAALYSEAGQMEFFIHDKVDSSGDGLKDTKRAGPTSTISVAVGTLDAYASEQSLTALDLLKIDTEGAELRVLQGAKNVMRDFKPKIIFEACPENTTAHGIDVREIYSFFRTMDYAVCSITGDHLSEPEFVSETARESNFLALPADHSVLVGDGARSR